MSGQFDLLALLFILLSLHFCLRYLDRRKKSSYFLSTATFLIALLSKESAIISIVLIYGIIARFHRRMVMKRSMILFLPYVAAASSYLLARTLLTGLIGGSYGDLTALYSKAKVLSNAFRYVSTFVLLGEKIFPAARVLAFLYAVVVVLAMVYAVIKRPVIAGVLSVLFLLALTPVLWVSSSPHTSDAGRMHYAPTVLLCILAAAGAESLIKTLKSACSHKIGLALQAALVASLVSAGLSTIYQGTVWKESASLANSIVHRVIKEGHRSKKNIYIKNLPYLFIEGPFILKSYAFRTFAAGRYGLRFPNLRSDIVYLSFRRREYVRYLGPDFFSDYGAKEGQKTDELTIDLPLEKLR